MAHNNNQEQSSFDSVTYKLPDGSVTLVSWEFIVGKLSEVINPIVTALSAENNSLDLIISKLDEWIPEE